jgi:hypothetical protein
MTRLALGALLLAVLAAAAPCFAADLPQCLDLAPPPAQSGNGTLSLTASCITRTKDFAVKHTFSFRLPGDLPSQARLTALTGSVSVTTSPDWLPPPASGGVSETLMGVSYATTSACPGWGEAVDGYAALFTRFPASGLGPLIMKQVAPGEAILPIDVSLPVGLPITGTCVMVTFDGTDFEGLPYTMASHLVLHYDTAPAPQHPPYLSSLGAEFVLGPGLHQPGTDRDLNAYFVLPVSNPGHVLAVYGDYAAAALHGPPHIAGDWGLRQVIAIYRDGSCASVFPPKDRTTYPNNLDAPFTWNDTGASALAPTALHLADTTLWSNGVRALNHAVVPVATFPVAVLPGDCLVQAMLPFGDHTTIGGGVNAESAISVERVDD